MVVNATTVFWEDLPPGSAMEGQLIAVTGRITNTGDEEQDFRLSVQIVGIGAGIFVVPLEVWSGAEELSPGEIYTANAYFRMPYYGMQLTVQAEWYDRTAGPAQWVKVGSTQSRNTAFSGVTPQFPVPGQPQAAMPVIAGLQIDPTIIVIGAVALGAIFILGRR